MLEARDVFARIPGECAIEIHLSIGRRDGAPIEESALNRSGSCRPVAQRSLARDLCVDRLRVIALDLAEPSVHLGCGFHHVGPNDGQRPRRTSACVDGC